MGERRRERETQRERERENASRTKLTGNKVSTFMSRENYEIKTWQNHVANIRRCWVQICIYKLYFDGCRDGIINITQYCNRPSINIHSCCCNYSCWRFESQEKTGIGIQESKIGRWSQSGSRSRSLCWFNGNWASNSRKCCSEMSCHKNRLPLCVEKRLFNILDLPPYAQCVHLPKLMPSMTTLPATIKGPSQK